MPDTKNECLARAVLLVLASGLLIGASTEATVDASFTFSPPNPVAGEEVQFTDTSTGNPTTWQWDFENPTGTDSTQQNPTWTFMNPGTYLVTLTALIPPLDIGQIDIEVVVVAPDPDPGYLSFTISSYTVGEDAVSASITVQRTAGSDGAVSVSCNTSDGSATAPADYTATADLLSWGDSDTSSKICTVPIVDDAEVEGDETVTVTLANVTGGANIVGSNPVTLTIIDNDLFADGFESGDTNAWSVVVTGSKDRASAGVMLSIRNDSEMSCGPVQLAPSVITGAIHIKVSTNDMLHLRLLQGDAEVVDLHVSGCAGGVITISGLDLESYELEIESEKGQSARFQVEVTAAAPCVALNLDLPGGL